MSTSCTNQVEWLVVSHQSFEYLMVSLIDEFIHYKNYKTLRRLKYSKLAIQLGMRHRTSTRPFIVRVLSQGKPMKNTVLQNRTCT